MMRLFSGIPNFLHDCSAFDVCLLINLNVLQEQPTTDLDPVTDQSTQAKESNQDAGFVEFPSKNINRKIAFASTFVAVGLFLSTRVDVGVSLKDLSVAALPYEEVDLSDMHSYYSD